MPAPDRIAALLAREIAAVTQALVNGGSVDRWERQMADAIARGHAAAAIAGEAERGIIGRGRAALAKWLGERVLPKATRDTIKAAVAGQLPYLRKFADDIRAGRLSDVQIAARAALYAGATRATYYQGRNAGWDLRNVPIPADGGTPCVSNCKCVAYEEDGQWIYELTAAEHCAGCLERAAKSPYPLQRLAA
jgi:hypothetical protein